MRVSLSREAQRDVAQLIGHYERLNRIEAALKLLFAIETAKRRIGRPTPPILPAPRPYPELADLGLRGIHVRRYWLAFLDEGGQRTIAAVLYDEADIPRRMGAD